MAARLGIFFGANVLFAAGLYFHALLYNFYLEALGFPADVMGNAAAALTAGGLAALLPAGRWVDRASPRAVVMSASVIGAAGLAAGAMVTQPWLIYVTAFTAGVGSGLWRVASAPILMELTDEANRPRVFAWNIGLLVTSGAGALALAGALPGWLGQNAGLDRLESVRLAMIAGAAGTVVSFPLFLAVPRRHRATPTVGTPGETARGSRVLWLIAIAAVALWMVGPAMIQPFYNLYFSRVHDLPVERIGLIFAAGQVVAGLSVFGSGEIAQRIGPRRTLRLWMFAFGPLLVLLAVVRSPGLAMALFLVAGIISPATNALIDQLLLERVPAGRRGAISSWRNAATEGSGAAGASAGGMLLSVSSFPGLLVSAAVAGTLGALALARALSARPDDPVGGR
jgi:MFS family permease